MYSRSLVFMVCAVTILCGNFVLGTSFQDCLRRDSISCLQIQVYQTAKSMMNHPSITILNGMFKIEMKSNSTQQKNNEKILEKSLDVESRQIILERYLIDTVENVCKERSITLSPSRIAEVVINATHNTLTNQLRSFLSQGIGKRKQLKMLTPILVAATLVFVTMASISFIVIAVIANKAVLAAVISLLLAGYEGITDILNPKKSIQPEDVVGYHTSGDWQPILSYDQQDISTSYSEPAPYHQMFIGQKGG